MGYLDFVSEIEASSLTGVSRATLNRFVEAGYLQIETDSDGLRLFSKNALIDLFGMKKPVYDRDFQDIASLAKPSPKNSEPEVAVADDNLKVETKISEPSKSEPSVAESQKATNSNGGKPSTLSAKIEVERSIQEAASASKSNGSEAVVVGAAAPKHEIREKVYTQPATAETQSTTTGSVEPVQASSLMGSDNDFELFKLKQVSSMLEKLLDIREGEIARLKEENTWLKARVERFESKGERDQMLLLSETQLIRSLLHYQEQRKSSFRLALEWLGFAKASPSRFSPPPRDLIDVGLEKKDGNG